jgi:hypothetical protein
MLDDEAGIGGDLVFLVILAHEAKGIPVIVVKLDILFLRQLCGDVLVPVGRIDQIALGIALGQQSHGGGHLIHDGLLVHRMSPV